MAGLVSELTRRTRTKYIFTFIVFCRGVSFLFFFKELTKQRKLFGKLMNNVFLLSKGKFYITNEKLTFLFINFSFFMIFYHIIWWQLLQFIYIYIHFLEEMGFRLLRGIHGVIWKDICYFCFICRLYGKTITNCFII